MVPSYVGDLIFSRSYGTTHYWAMVKIPIDLHVSRLTECAPGLGVEWCNPVFFLIRMKYLRIVIRFMQERAIRLLVK